MMRIPIMSPKSSDGGVESEVVEWEVRPGGMLVQKRTPESEKGVSLPPSPTIRVKVKYGSIYHQVYINSQATFGELKKKLAAPTGLDPQDQKLLYKDKERDSKTYLDVVGVKDRSKILLLEDPTSQERRYIEMQKTAKMEKASKSISGISLEVDKLAAQVSSLETVISKGGKVAENDVLNLIELLMSQLIKLDGIVADGDAKLQRRMQVKRVQKCVESLDLMKINIATPYSNGVHSQIPRSNGVPSKFPLGSGVPNKSPLSNGAPYKSPLSNGVQDQSPRSNEVHAPFPFTNGGQTLMPRSNGDRTPVMQQRQQKLSAGQMPVPIQPKQQRQEHRPPQHDSAAKDIVVTTKWETFDLAPGLMHLQNPNTSTPTPNKLNWEFFE
ncbi:hypothetical protein GIB67_028308 [Kingdonia uniflora]|uniref:BAG family molecular chaperone regulator 1 n=1 Tax=Kingdonia uniflora TaxID=39325 RepID=A0A7J7MHP4_9MAGN|nr:hypothetical protein GIB67_028308 [Kingdonia uniflora]